MDDFNPRDYHGLETNFIRILYYDLPKYFIVDYNSQNNIAFCTIIDGKNHILFNKYGISYDNDKYALLSYNSNVQMKMDIKTKGLIIELKQELINTVMNKVQIESIYDENYNDTYCLGDNSQLIREDVKDIIEASSSKQSNKVFLIDLYAQKLVYDLLKDKKTLPIINTDTNHPINIAINYINENIEDMINIREIAKQLHMSESNFSYMFKKIKGIKPSDYIKNKKLELAKEYLRRESVTDVAFNLGYANISYFIKLFKIKYKMTPKQYKMTHYDKKG
ncbi:MAG: AraC family transcriptional regulator [Vallitalea sp.]|jgi:AraC-like DNA-binding protein|nr:AraC family transcriptional regulator [Vallitalea sp.]